MKISARNQLKGTVKEITVGVVTSQILLDIGDGHTISSIISKESSESLGLKVGDEATAIIKATSVMIMA